MGVQATSQIKENRPDVQVVLLTTTPDEELVIRGISVGADGFLLKELYPENLHRAIRDAYRGQTVFNGEVASILSGRVRELTLSNKQILGENHGLFLTDRELHIAYLIMEKHSNKQTADKLFLAKERLKFISVFIYYKLQIHKRNEVIEFLHTVPSKTASTFIDVFRWC
ncbi:hypothetical protein GCM10009001_24460 [Virgibacillus siamensis]|uniref:Response regulatory domain-containing protein n=1 Tax=Virgibacillus siamensis TaxID=480071 RepID=A0ABP3REY1_9BACI